MAKRIAFIGLGNMGGGMAANLVAKGFKVEAYDLDPAALGRAKLAGCGTHTSINAALDGVDAVVTMLPDGKIVRSVFANDVLKWTPKSALLIDCSTIDVATATEVMMLAASQGYAIVDAPVSGGIGAANAGTLTFMVGGTEAAFAAAIPSVSSLSMMASSSPRLRGNGIDTPSISHTIAARNGTARFGPLSAVPSRFGVISSTFRTCDKRRFRTPITRPRSSGARSTFV